MRLEAPAKLNLTLRVVGRRDDGYHELASDLVLLELADRLLLLPGCSGLRVEGGDRIDDVPLGPDNLAWRGLVAAIGSEPDLACLALEKRIPTQAGLAGGSSDAAAAWRLGRAVHGRSDRADEAEVASLAAIGADVPFFAAQVAAGRVRGIGERVEALEPMAREVVLVHPPFGLPTRAVFAELRPAEYGSAENDLLGPALRLRPELATVIDDVAAAGGAPRLTGSGPTVYVLTDYGERANAVAAALRTRGHAVTRTRTRTAPATIEAIDETDEEIA